MAFWEFANNHEFIALLGVWCLCVCTASSIKYISRALSGRPIEKKASAKTEPKAPRADAKASEKAH